MCTFIFRYIDDSEHEFDHIRIAEYSLNDEKTIVTENELLTHGFPTNIDLHLFAEGSNFTVSGKDLVWIEVKSEG